ncbi:predicted protein [Sclerotinia sclerotiorum 1980 UF-70]|uniref:Uncharacterized protein n=1 Tax=Sclerotinia sclerotiorum (strain ATCC 18683 / 1980 / Ss-1) TaxID=665079 RepID=A7EZM4_SCLS1|nr:predicted protein [Sclerotinia sclerotiorum 1980 UF-70]EDN94916.1 predicted protein [Sclerotinia sclerotiorum 1980 UF-70]
MCLTRTRTGTGTGTRARTRTTSQANESINLYRRTLEINDQWGIPAQSASYFKSFGLLVSIIWPPSFLETLIRPDTKRAYQRMANAKFSVEA